jgi:GNAT superfamily N-acetyltransferase
MPWVVRDTVDEINRAVGRRWQGLDRLLPPRAELPEGCAAPFVATGTNGRPAGLAACRHEHVKVGTLNQTWGPADRFSLIARLREADTSAALDDLVGDGEPVGLIHVQPPEQSRWITGMTRAGVTVYLQTMFVRPGDRGGGVGEALVRHVHAVLHARGVDTTLLHFAQLNPLSAPFWSRMGYRPLWIGWEVRPAASLR